MDYKNISKESMAHVYAAYTSLNESPLAAGLRVLIELRVSQINGCDPCCQIHTQTASTLGVSQSKMKSLSEFMTSFEFSDAEKEALKWAETLTHLDGNTRVEHTDLSQYFSEREIVDITICISLMNAMNRIAISMKEA